MCLMAVFAASVRALVTRVVEHLDGGPPRVEGVPQPGGLVGVGVFHPAFEPLFGVTGLVEGWAGEDEPEAFLDVPQAAPSSPVGSSLVNTSSSRWRARSERVS